MTSLAKFYCLCGCRFEEVEPLRKHWFADHPDWDWAGWCAMYGVEA